MSLSSELICALLFLVTLVRPAIGVGIWVALIPLLDYGFGVPQLSYNVLTVFGAAQAAAVLIRQLRAGWAFWRPLLIFGGILGLLLTASLLHYGSILWAFPRLLPENLFAAGQLNPFVPLGRATLWAIAAVLFLGLVRSCRESAADRRGLLILLWLQAPVFLGVLAWDFARNGKPFPATLLQNHQESIPGLFAIFSEHNALASFFLLHAFLMVGAVIVAPTRRARILFLLPLALYTILIGLCLSLTGLLAAGLAGAALVILVIWGRRRAGDLSPGWSRPDRRAVAAVGLVMAAAIALAGVSVGGRQIGEAVRSRITTASWQGLAKAFYERRGYGWAVAGDMIRDYPFLGVGLGRFYLEFHDYRARRGTAGAGWFWEHSQYENAHNYYLQIAAESGLLGLFLLIAFLARIFSSAFRGPPESVTAACGLLAMAAVSLLQHPLLVEALFFTAVPLAALAAVPESRLPRLRGKPLWLLLLVLAVGGLFDLRHAAGSLPSEFEYGLSPVEQGAGESYRWTGRIALKRAAWKPGGERVRVRTAVTDLRAHPMLVRFRRMNDRSELDRWSPENQDWTPLELSLRPGDLLAITCSRVLQPPGEYRKLGIAITLDDDSGFRPLELRLEGDPPGPPSD